MIDNDQQITKIIQKVLTKKSDHDRNPSQKYLSHTDNSNENYQLQVENSNLQKKYITLQKLFRNHQKKEQQSKSLNDSVKKTKQKLKGILNANQSLEQSLCKIRAQSILNTSKESEIERSGKTKQKEKKSRLTNIQPFTSIQKSQKIPKEDQQMQCYLSEIQESQKKQLSQKRKYIFQLEKIILKQDKILEDYQRKSNQVYQVGKFAKAKDLKEKKILRSDSVGTIIKTKRIFSQN